MADKDFIVKNGLVTGSNTLTVGSALTVNTTAINHVGSVNAASHTVGTSTIANSTGVYTDTVNAASHTVGTSTVANSTGVYTGTVNATSVNAASHTVGTSTVANSTGVYATTVNAASHTIGSDFIANSTGLYHTGTANVNTLNAGSLSSASQGVTAYSNNNQAIYGISNSNVGVQGVSNSNYGVLGTSNTGVGVLARTLSTGPSLVASNNTVNHLVAAANGNIGIATDTPAAKLDVNGQVNATSHTVGTSFVANSSQITVGGTLIANSTGPYGKTEGNLNVNNALTANNSSNLGGTASASYRLKSDGQVVPSGYISTFNNSNAPTGWTKLTTRNDYAIRIVSGNVSAKTDGVGFTSAFASQSVSGTISSTTAGGNITGGVNAYTLTTSDIPSHSHGGDAGNQFVFLGSGSFGGSGNSRYGANRTAAEGGSGSHSHGHSLGFSGSSHNHSLSGTAINLAVNYVDFILAQAD